MMDVLTQWKMKDYFDWHTTVPPLNQQKRSVPFLVKGNKYCLNISHARNGIPGSCDIFLIQNKNPLLFHHPFFVRCKIVIPKETDHPDHTDHPDASIDSTNNQLICNFHGFFDLIVTEPIFIQVNFIDNDHITPIRILSQTQTENKFVQTETAFNCLAGLSDDFAKLLDAGLDPDVEMKCGDKTIKAHRSVLSSRSDVFAAMLQSDMVEGRTGLVELKDMEVSHFQELVRYLYTATVDNLTFDMAMNLYEIGDEYNVKRLMERCSAFMVENLAIDNACQCLALADVHSDEKFTDSVTSFVLYKKIHLMENIWLPFSESFPRPAVRMLNRSNGLPRKKLT